MTLATAQSAPKASKRVPAVYGGRFEDLLPPEIASAVTGYELRHMIEALVAGISEKKIPIAYSGNGACTNDKFMILPTLPQAYMFKKLHADILIGYAAHEVCHHLFTDFAFQYAEDPENPTKREMQRFQWFNAIEDYRIEKLVKPRYPGFHRYINVLRNENASRFVSDAKADKLKPEALSNPYKIGAVALTWIGAGLNGYPTRAPEEAVDCLDPDLQAYIRSLGPRMAVVGTQQEAFDLACEIMDELDQANNAAGEGGDSEPDQDPADEDDEDQGLTQSPSQQNQPDEEDDADSDGDDQSSDGAEEDGDQSSEGDAAGEDASDGEEDVDASSDGNDPAEDAAEGQNDAEEGDEGSASDTDEGDADVSAAGTGESDVDADDDSEAAGDQSSEGAEAEAEADGAEAEAEADGSNDDGSEDTDGDDQCDSTGDDAGGSDAEGDAEQGGAGENSDDSDGQSTGSGQQSADNDYGTDEAGSSPDNRGDSADGDSSQGDNADGSNTSSGQQSDASDDNAQSSDGGSQTQDDAGEGDASADQSSGGDGQKVTAPSTSEEDREAEADKADLNIDDMLDSLSDLITQEDIDELAKHDPINDASDAEKADAAQQNDEDASPQARIGANGNATDEIHRAFVARCQGEYAQVKRTLGTASARAAGIIRRMLMSRNKTSRRTNLEEGSLDLKRLVQIVNAANDVYFETKTKRDVNTAVSILLDNSGSMSGAKLALCQKAAVILDQAIASTGTDLEITGFTSINWSTPAVYFYRRFGQKGQAAAASLGRMLNIDLGSTPLSQPMLDAHLRLQARKAPRKIMILVTDGGVDDVGRTRMVHDMIVMRGIKVIGVGLADTAIANWCENYRIVNNIEEFPSALAELVKEAIMGNKRRAA